MDTIEKYEFDRQGFVVIPQMLTDDEVTTLSVAMDRYSFNGRGIDCMMVRMIYFVQDVTNAQGAFSVVPGTHKSNYPSPYRGSPDAEPGMIGLPVKAGDAILFTENLRHGGLTNDSEQVRKTLHVGYGPVWMMSQNM